MSAVPLWADQPLSPAELIELFLDQLEALAQARRLALEDRLAGQRSVIWFDPHHPREVGPAELLVDPEHQQCLILARQRLAQGRDACLAPGAQVRHRLAAQLLLQRRQLGVVGERYVQPGAPACIAAVSRRQVSSDGVCPGSKRALPLEPGQPRPDALSE